MNYLLFFCRLVGAWSLAVTVGWSFSTELYQECSSCSPTQEVFVTFRWRLCGRGVKHSLDVASATVTCETARWLGCQKDRDRCVVSIIIQQAGGFLRPDCALGSECPRASIAARRHTASSITISRRASCCCSSAIAGIAIGANFKMYLLRQFCWNRVQIFLQYTGDTDAKNDRPEFWNSNSVIFDNFFEIFKKASCGPSAADLHHYGRDQARSE